MIAPVVPTAAIAPDVTFPGDIDLLIIPYADDNLILSDTLAIEIKVVRAKYARQGKAPNEFGFSQANAIFTHGVPYSAVVHLVVSDTSPEDQWRGMHAANVIDVHAGSIGPLYPIQIDMMPADLIDRSFGRLSANCPHDSLGLVAAYISFNDSGWWQPMARRALKNTSVSRSFLAGVEKYYTENYSIFLDTPKYPPSR
ncbi:hypothetical protein GTP45_26160 [Pseudoduganella sp. FT55W]|uniref:Uncharacterized protein n=1 Tax=Duganella rivi TaxID=2666083 RepID=A0A7X4GW85_9BURK|nr:hypothetical protein [Duganella rivi]MYM70264.1 hypothetical protein [Duganella rivi]